MVKIILVGYLGKMGRVICSMVEDSKSSSRRYEIVAGVDILPARSAMAFPTFMDIRDCNVSADVIIDYSGVDGVSALVDYAAEKQMPLIICTTGLTKRHMDKISSAAEKTAIFQSANMSLGINLIADMLDKSAKILDDAGFDIEIIEKHHNQKLDAPSGTALLLAEAINKSFEDKFKLVYDRSKEMSKRTRHEIGVHSIRGGTIVGEHSVIFAGNNEVIEFKHMAQSKEVFATGTLAAAGFMKGKKTGLYNMSDLINS